MATRNDVTGHEIKSRTISSAYVDNWDAIFGKKKEPEVQEEIASEVEEPVCTDTPTT